MASSFDEPAILDLIRTLLRKQATGLLPKTAKEEFDSYSHKSGHYVFEFPAAAASDWYADDNGFGASRIDQLDPTHEYFRSIKVLGTGDFATVNKAFFQRFKQISTRLGEKVGEVLEKKKVKSGIVVFTGHSSGGAIAILATVWFLEQYRDSNITPLCITYGAPLVGDKFFGHALRREHLLHNTNKSWASCFINVVSIRDLAPRILLSRREDLQPYLQSVFQTWGNRKRKEQIASTPPDESYDVFFTSLVNNAFAVASYDSCVLRSSAGGSSLLEAVKDIVELSPYRPFGSFYFCVGEGKPLLRVDNHDAVLQILFYSLQLDGPGSHVDRFVQQSVLEHRSYEAKTKDLNAIFLLDNLNKLPLSPQANVNPAFDALGLSVEARLSLRAAGEVEKKKAKNKERVEGYYPKVKEYLEIFQAYRSLCEAKGMCYYDAFKLHRDLEDFKAYVDRYELISIWEEIRELFRLFELPDSFELDRELVKIATDFRLLLEPIDIANYYRRDLYRDAGLYEKDSKARPKYYKYPESWLKHLQRFTPEEEDELGRGKVSLDSCFWARVENMCLELRKGTEFAELEGVVLKFENEVRAWFDKCELGQDVLMQGSTFLEWWALLPWEHRARSCIREHIEARCANGGVNFHAGSNGHVGSMVIE